MRASDLLKIEEAATYCGVSVNTIHGLRNRKCGPRAIRLGKRLMFDPVDLDAWIEARREPWADGIAELINEEESAA